MIHRYKKPGSSTLNRHKDRNADNASVDEFDRQFCDFSIRRRGPIATTKMRMHFAVPLMTLLPLVIGKTWVPSGDQAVDAESGHSAPRVHMWVTLMDSGLNRTLCGASILDQTKVLTLSRCVSNRKPKNFKVVVYPYSGQVESVYGVKSVTFRTDRTNSENDVAIVVIDGTFRFSRKIFPVCLPCQHATDTFVGSTVTSLAWKRATLPTGFSEDLYYHGHPIVTSNVECDSELYDVTTNILCNDMTQRGAAYFYGGEPIYWMCPKTKIAVQIGVVCRLSYNDDQSISMLRVGGFVDWIRTHVDMKSSWCETV